MAAESTFSRIRLEWAEGFITKGLLLWARLRFIENAAADGGGAVFNVHQLTFADGAVFSGNSATDGGAVYNDFSEDKDGNAVSAGSLAFNGGARFIGNTASGLAEPSTTPFHYPQSRRGAGGSCSAGIRTPRARTRSSWATVPVWTSRETARSSLMMRCRLKSATPALKKTGSGELLLNASMDGFLGTASFEGRLTSIAEKWLIKNLITIAGGKLKMSEFSLCVAGRGERRYGRQAGSGRRHPGDGDRADLRQRPECRRRRQKSRPVKLNGDNWSFDSGDCSTTPSTT